MFLTGNIWLVTGRMTDERPMFPASHVYEVVVRPRRRHSNNSIAVHQFQIRVLPEPQ